MAFFVKCSRYGVIDMVAIAVKIEHKKAVEYADLCLQGYGDGRWNYASYGMASYIKIFDKQIEERIKAKETVRQSIHHLQSLLDLEKDFEESSLVVEKAHEALEKL